MSLDIQPQPTVARASAPRILPGKAGIALVAGTAVASPWARRLAIAALAFLLAFAADVATGRQLSAVWGSAAILVSALALVPALRRIALPAGAWIGLWIAFNLFRAAADTTLWPGTVSPLVPDLEQRLLGGSPTAMLQEHLYRLGHPGLLDILAAAVHLSFFVVPHAVAALLLIRARPRFRRYLIATAIMLAAATVLFVLLPTAPPWMVPMDGDGQPVTRITGVVLSEIGLFPAQTRPAGPQAAHFPFEQNPVAAMPSIHLGATALIAASAISARRLRLLAVLYCVAMGFSLVYLGEHHVLDVLAGAALAALAWRLTEHTAP